MTKKTHDMGDPKNTNSLRIKWPQDAYGTCMALRKGGLASVTRIGGNDKKLEDFLLNLRLLAQFAKASTVEVQKQRLSARENAAHARIRTLETRTRQAEATAAEWEAQAARVRKAAGITPDVVEITAEVTAGPGEVNA